MFDLKEIALINSERPFTIEFKDGTTKTYNKVSVYEVESIQLDFVGVTNKDTGDSALWLSNNYGAVQRLASRLDMSYLPDTVPADISEVRFYNNSLASVIDVVTLTNLSIYLKTEYCRSKYGADIDVTWVSAMQGYNGIKFSFDSENKHTIEVLNGTAYNGLKYTDGFCIIAKDHRYDNELVTTVYLKLDNSIIKYAEPLMVDSKRQEMSEYVRKTISNKIIAFNENSMKVIYGKKHVLLTLENDHLYISCDETNKSRSTMLNSLTPEGLEELAFTITSE